MFYHLQEHEWNFILCSKMIGVCICSCIYVRLCENTYGDQWSMLGSFLCHSPPYILRQLKLPLIEIGAHLQDGQ